MVQGAAVYTGKGAVGLKDLNLFGAIGTDLFVIEELVMQYHV